MKRYYFIVGYGLQSNKLKEKIFYVTLPEHLQKSEIDKELSIFAREYFNLEGIDTKKWDITTFSEWQEV